MLTYEGHDSAVEYLESLAGQVDELEYVDAMPPIDCAELVDSRHLGLYIAGLLDGFGYSY